jgi:hypothetical protein
MYPIRPEKTGENRRKAEKSGENRRKWKLVSGSSKKFVIA